jgi:general secretion pathway protein M
MSHGSVLGMRRGDAKPWAWAFWLAVLAGLLAVLGTQAWSAHDTARQQLQDLEPRYARMLGLGSEKGNLQAAYDQAGKAIARHAYPASRDVSQAGNDAQQRVREVFSKAGLDVISIQVLAAKSAGGFDRVPLALRVEGEMTALQAALATLPAAPPTLFVEGFSMQSANALKPEAPVRVVAQLSLFVLRAQH